VDDNNPFRDLHEQSDSQGGVATVNPYASPANAAETIRQDPTRMSIGQLLFGIQGRIPRRTYWAAMIGVTIVYYVLLGTAGLIFQDNEPMLVTAVMAIAIPVIWSSFAVQAKRWHDRNKSGWWSLISLVPVIGPIWALVECGCLRGTEGPNSYGADPT